MQLLSWNAFGETPCNASPDRNWFLNYNCSLTLLWVDSPSVCSRIAHVGTTLMAQNYASIVTAIEMAGPCSGSERKGALSLEPSRVCRACLLGHIPRFPRPGASSCRAARPGCGPSRMKSSLTGCCTCRSRRPVPSRAACSCPRSADNTACAPSSGKGHRPLRGLLFCL